MKRFLGIILVAASLLGLTKAVFWPQGLGWIGQILNQAWPAWIILLVGGVLILLTSTRYWGGGTVAPEPEIKELPPTVIKKSGKRRKVPTGYLLAGLAALLGLAGLVGLVRERHALYVPLFLTTYGLTRWSGILFEEHRVVAVMRDWKLKKGEQKTHLAKFSQKTRRLDRKSVV